MTVADLVQQTKFEMAEFQQRKAKIGDIAKGRCANKLDIELKGVTITINSAFARSTTGEFSAEIPLGTGSIGPNFSASNGVSGTQTLTFSLYGSQPVPGVTPNPAPRNAKFEGTPIADALESVYRSLANNSDYTPCVNFGSPDDQDNSAEMGMKFEAAHSAGATIKIVVFSIGGGKQSSRSTENTLKAHFVLSGTAIT